MTPEMIVTMLTVLLGGSLVGAFLGHSISRKRLPIERQSSVITDSEKINTIALSTLERVDGELADTRKVLREQGADIKELGEKSAQQDIELHSLRRHINMWVTWAEGVRINWPILRLQDEAPEPPSMKVEA